jgi:hypothetical protein
VPSKEKHVGLAFGLFPIYNSQAIIAVFLKWMIHLSKIIYGCLLWTLVPASSEAQSAFLSAFSGFQMDQSVLLNFTIRGGITCLGIDIERSSDSINFKVIGSISGICGSTSEEVTYSFEDSDPLINQPNHYRLLLGQVGYSEILAVAFLDYTNGAVVIPNPFLEKTTIYFPDGFGNDRMLKLFDLAGKLVRQQPVSGNAIELEASGFSPGLYLFCSRRTIKYFLRGRIVVQ